MKEREVRDRAFAMPLTQPACPPGPYRFVNRDYFIITYRTDPEKLRALVPEPLEIEAPLVKYEFIRMPDSTGFGDYTVGYKYRALDTASVQAALSAPNYLFKIIPHVDGSPRICELVEYCLEGIEVKGAWTGPAALSLMPHALTPVAELPVLEVVAAVHTVADLTLGLGRDPPLRESRAWAGADGYVDYAGGHADQHQGVPPSRRIRQLRRRSAAAGALDRDGE